MLTPVTSWEESAGMPLLSLMTIMPLVGLTIVLKTQSAKAKFLAGYIATSLNLLLSLYLLLKFDDNNTGIQFAEQFSLYGMNYRVGVDGLNILFVPLVACLSWLTLIYLSATGSAQKESLIAPTLGYEAILIAAFCAMNLLQFWFLMVLELVPIVFVTYDSGLDQKKRQLLVRFLQFFVSSLLMTLCGFLLLAFGLIDSEHELTFDLLTLQNNNTYLHDETLIFVMLFYGFAIRMPLFPFHGWLPHLAEQSKLTCLTVFIIGAKLGIYAMIRFIFPLVPGIAEQWADYVVVLCLISIFYGALLAFMQNNAYRLLAFASISHTGMLVFGVFSFNEHGLEGTLLLALVYGLASVGMLFSISLIHEQTRTAIIPRLGNLFDSHTTLALLFMITALSTMIMPGSLGFDAGHLLLEGVIEEHEWGVAVTILTGHVLAAGFLLWAFQRIFLATSKRRIQFGKSNRATIQKTILAFVICALHIGTGLNSMPLLNLIDKDVVALVSQYPIHSSQPKDTLFPDEDENIDDNGVSIGH